MSLEEVVRFAQLLPFLTAVARLEGDGTLTLGALDFSDPEQLRFRAG